MAKMQKCADGKFECGGNISRACIKVSSLVPEIIFLKCRCTLDNRCSIFRSGCDMSVSSCLGQMKN